MKFYRLSVVASVLGFMVIPVRSVANHPADGKLGTVHFVVSGKAEAQQHVVRGVKLTHHMMYPEAERAFAAAVAADPKCALAYWGRALTLIHPLWPDAPTEAERKLGADQVRLGLACPPATPRERAYLETLNRYFGETATGDHVTGLKLLDGAWAELAEKYPDDL